MSEKSNVKQKKGLSRLFQIAGKRKGLCVLASVLSVLSSLSSFVPFYSIYKIIESIIHSHGIIINKQELIFWGLIALAGAVGNIALYFLSLAFSHIAAYGTLYQLRIEFAEHLVKLPIGFINLQGSGKLRKIMDDNIESLEGFIAHDLPDMVSAIVSPCIIFVILFVVDWHFGLMTLIGVIITFLLLGISMGGPQSKVFMKKYMDSLEEMSNASVEYVRGISVVKAFNQTVFSFKKLYTSIENYTKSVIPFTLSSENGMALATAALNSMYICLIPMAIHLGKTTTDFALFLTNFLFYLMFIPPIASVIMKVMFVFVNTSVIAENTTRMDNVLNEQPLLEGDCKKLPDISDIEFKNVSFKYNDKDGYVLNNVNFTAKEGQLTAVVGPSGGGKSTIANLIPRFYDVNDGAINIGNINIKDINNEALMEMVSFVFQDNFLFKASIADNVNFGCKDASREDIIRACKAAQCHDFINNLPDGYDTVFGSPGVNLSGGEIQRISIARAILKDSPILVLDEATSFSDPENEALIQKAIEQLIKDKTVIMIAHRLSTIKNADKIIVVNNGNIEGIGTHDTLLKDCPLYVKMWDDYSTSIGWKF